MSVEPPTPVKAPWSFGVGLEGYMWPSSSPRGVLLLQHGYAEHVGRFVDHYRRLIAHLVAAGFDVHGFDMPGHGRSPGRRGSVDLRDVVSYHLAARAELAKQPYPVFLLGHSAGGLVTAVSAMRDPHCIAGVILSAPALLIAATRSERALAAILAGLLPHIGVRRAQDLAGLSSDPAAVAAIYSDPLVYRGPLSARFAASALALSDEGWRRYAAWTLPVLTLHGTGDVFTDPEGSIRFDNLVAAQDHRLELFPGARHELLNDHVGDTVRETILSWLLDRTRDGHHQSLKTAGQFG